MNRTFFNFEDAMTSKELMEAIATPHGVGPFCGFGGHKFSADGTQIILTPEPGDGNEVSADGPFYNQFYNIIHDKIKARNIFRLSDDNATNFGCITKDGCEFISSDGELPITIEGTRGVNTDVIILAVHSPIDEAIDNPVEFRAFWSQSSVNFYDLYRRSIDPGYPTEVIDRSLVITSNDPLSNNEFTYNKLLEMVVGSLPAGVYDADTMTLIGIYGQGNNAMNDNMLENFRIIPYNSKFPMEVPSNTATWGLLKNVIYKLAKSIGVPVTESTEEETPVQQVTNVQQVTQKINMPKGSIIMWYGAPQTIPTGWELCDGGISVNDPTISKPNLMGRVPVGLSTLQGDYNMPLSMGGSENVTLKKDQMPRHNHIYTDDSNAPGKYDNIERGFPRKISNRDTQCSIHGGSGAGYALYTTMEGGITKGAEGSANPIDIRQPYTVVAFIIKTTD